MEEAFADTKAQVMKSCMLEEEQYLKEVTFDLNQRFALDDKHKESEKRRNDPASFIAKDKINELISVRQIDLEQLKDEVQPAISTLKEKSSVLKI